MMVPEEFLFVFFTDRQLVFVVVFRANGVSIEMDSSFEEYEVGSVNDAVRVVVVAGFVFHRHLFVVAL